jgi:flagellar biosynthesis component FlhA
VTHTDGSKRYGLLTGIAIALISLLLLPLRVPPPLVVLGWITGVALAVYVPLTTLWRETWMSTPALTAELLAMTVWALVLGIVLRRSSPAHSV